MPNVGGKDNDKEDKKDNKDDNDKEYLEETSLEGEYLFNICLNQSANRRDRWLQI